MQLRFIKDKGIFVYKFRFWVGDAEHFTLFNTDITNNMHYYIQIQSDWSDPKSDPLYANSLKADSVYLGPVRSKKASYYL